MKSGKIVTLCSEGWHNIDYEQGYWIAMFVISYLVPLLVIFVVHIIMLYVMIKDRNSEHREQNKRMIKMIIAVVSVFTVCTGVQHVYFFFSTYANLSDRTRTLFFITSNFFVSLQAALNPVIYGTFRQDFKKAFHSLVVKLLLKLNIQRLHKVLMFDEEGNRKD